MARLSSPRKVGGGGGGGGGHITLPTSAPNMIQLTAVDMVIRNTRAWQVSYVRKLPR